MGTNLKTFIQNHNHDTSTPHLQKVEEIMKITNALYKLTLDTNLSTCERNS